MKRTIAAALAALMLGAPGARAQTGATSSPGMPVQQPGQPDFVTELIDLFVGETGSRLKAMHLAVSSNDATEIRRLAHFLKGSSANIGARQMAATYEELEEKDELVSDTEGLLKRLDQEFESVREALKAERREMSH